MRAFCLVALVCCCFGCSGTPSAPDDPFGPVACTFDDVLLDSSSPPSGTVVSEGSRIMITLRNGRKLQSLRGGIGFQREDGAVFINTDGTLPQCGFQSGLTVTLGGGNPLLGFARGGIVRPILLVGTPPLYKLTSLDGTTYSVMNEANVTGRYNLGIEWTVR